MLNAARQRPGSDVKTGVKERGKHYGKTMATTHDRVRMQLQPESIATSGLPISFERACCVRQVVH